MLRANVVASVSADHNEVGASGCRLFFDRIINVFAEHDDAFRIEFNSCRADGLHTVFRPAQVVASVCGPSLGSKIAVPIGSGHSSIHQEVAAGDEPAVRAHEKRPDNRHFVWSASAPSRGQFDHAPVPCATRPT